MEKFGCCIWCRHDDEWYLVIKSQVDCRVTSLRFAPRNDEYAFVLGRQSIFCEYFLWSIDDKHNDYEEDYFLSIQNNIFINERTSAKRAVERNHPVSNQSTILSTSRIINTPMIKENRPSVRILSGNVSKRRIDPIIPLTSARTTATTIATRYQSTVTFGTMYAAIPIASALSKILMISVFIVEKKE